VHAEQTAVFAGAGILLNFSKDQKTTGMTLSRTTTAISAWYATKCGRNQRFTQYYTTNQLRCCIGGYI